MYFFSEDPLIKSNTDNFYNILTSLKKNDSVQPAIDYLTSIDNDISLYYQLNRKSTYAVKIYKLLNQRPEHFKGVLLHLLDNNKRRYSEFIQYLSHVQFDPNGKYHQEFLEFAFYNPKCFEYTQKSSFWGNYILDNFTINNKFTNDIKKHLDNLDNISFRSHSVFNKLTEFHGSKNYSLLLDFLKKHNFDFDLKKIKTSSLDYDNQDKVYPNFYIPYHFDSDGKIEQNIIYDYLSFFKINEFPIIYQKSIFKNLIKEMTFSSFRKLDDFFKIFFELNQVISFDYERYDENIKKHLKNSFNYMLNNNISFSFIENNIIEKTTKNYNKHTITERTNLLHLLIDEYFDKYSYSMNEPQFYKIIDSLSQFKSNTGYLLEKFISNERNYFFPVIAEKNMDAINDFFNSNTENLPDFIYKARQILKTKTREGSYYTDFVSKIKIKNIEKINFRKVFISDRDDESKDSFFNFFFNNNLELAHALFNGFSQALIEDPYMGIRNLAYHEQFLKSEWFTEQEYINKNNIVLQGLSIPNILKNENNNKTIIEIKGKIAEKEKLIISSHIENSFTEDSSDTIKKRL